MIADNFKKYALWFIGIALLCFFILLIVSVISIIRNSSEANLVRDALGEDAKWKYLYEQEKERQRLLKEHPDVVGSDNSMMLFAIFGPLTLGLLGAIFFVTRQFGIGKKSDILNPDEKREIIDKTVTDMAVSSTQTKLSIPIFTREMIESLAKEIPSEEFKKQIQEQNNKIFESTMTEEQKIEANKLAEEISKKINENSSEINKKYAENIMKIIDGTYETTGVPVKLEDKMKAEQEKVITEINNLEKIELPKLTDETQKEEMKKEIEIKREEVKNIDSVVNSLSELSKMNIENLSISINLLQNEKIGMVSTTTIDQTTKNALDNIKILERTPITNVQAGALHILSKEVDKALPTVNPEIVKENILNIAVVETAKRFEVQQAGIERRETVIPEVVKVIPRSMEVIINSVNAVSVFEENVKNIPVNEIITVQEIKNIAVQDEKKLAEFKDTSVKFNETIQVNTEQQVEKITNSEQGKLIIEMAELEANEKIVVEIDKKIGEVREYIKHVNTVTDFHNDKIRKAKIQEMVKEKKFANERLAERFLERKAKESHTKMNEKGWTEQDAKEIIQQLEDRAKETRERNIEIMERAKIHK